VLTFSSDAGSHPGLNLLAARALVGGAPGLPAGAPTHGYAASKALLSETGPYNPAASISTKIVKCMLDLEFVETAEILTDDDIQEWEQVLAAYGTFAVVFVKQTG